MSGLRALARQLGGDVAGSHGIVMPGPGHSKHDRSLSVTFRPDAPDGFLVTSHAGDNFRECRDHVRSRLGLGGWRPSRPVPVPKIQKTPDGQDISIVYALRIWNAATNPRGTVVEAYLQRRGLDLGNGIAVDVLRFHPALKLDEARVPALIALFRDIVTDEPCGIHRTFLSGDGRKLDRKMLGRSAGAAIKLDGHDAVTTGLTIGEGLETVMTGRLAGFTPAWALGSSGKIASFPVMTGIETLTVLVEIDDSGASEKALRACADRWLPAGADVLAVTPRRGSDLNDLIRRDRQ